MPSKASALFWLIVFAVFYPLSIAFVAAATESAGSSLFTAGLLGLIWSAPVSEDVKKLRT